MHDVRRAGERLAGAVLWNEDDREAIYRTFAIASSWRDSHVYPMRSVRMSLIQRMRKLEVSGFSASRPKSMASVRRKLRLRSTMKLDKINDLAGCRVVADDIAGLWSMVHELGENFPHPVRGRAYDYVTKGKDDGYRSYHVVFDFQTRDHEAAFDGRRVELQVRTLHHHSLATAVEAVGLFRRENLKGGDRLLKAWRAPAKGWLF
jgi:(p)ppGpp synthase/HD superfamily hydrolase